MKADVSELKRLHDAIDAALADSAPLAWRIAPATCHRNQHEGTSCAYYHRVWQYLVLLGAISSIRTDSAFLIDALDRVLHDDSAARILICGSADYGVLAHVLWAAQEAKAQPEITVLDRCDTSLTLNRWYADRVGADVATVNADILDWQPPAAFDAIVSHSFLGWFSDADRPRLIGAWHALLRPGGCVVTTKRLRNTPPGEAHQKFPAAEADAFADRVRTLAVRSDIVTGIAPDALYDAALAYARGHVRYPMRTRDELASLFENGGFSLEQIGAPGERTITDRPSGPLARAGRRYQIIARRPA